MKNDKKALENLISELHWMARRYADNRTSGVTRLFNDVTKKLLRMGVRLESGKEGCFAKDRMGRSYDGLSEAEAAAIEDRSKTDPSDEAMAKVATAAIKLADWGFFSAKDAKDGDVQELLLAAFQLKTLRNYFPKERECRHGCGDDDDDGCGRD
jgi:hypothetical protein